MTPQRPLSLAVSPTGLPFACGIDLREYALVHFGEGGKTDLFMSPSTETLGPDVACLSYLFRNMKAWMDGTVICLLPLIPFSFHKMCLYFSISHSEDEEILNNEGHECTSQKRTILEMTQMLNIRSFSLIIS